MITMATKLLSIPSNPKRIVELEGFLTNVLSDLELSKERYPEMLISLTEAVNNAIIHGNKLDESKQVKINCEKSGKHLCFSISDEGDGFDVREVPDPTSDNLIDCCGGRGVFIMTNLCDRIQFKNNGSTVEMYFKR